MELWMNPHARSGGRALPLLLALAAVLAIALLLLVDPFGGAGDADDDAAGGPGGVDLLGANADTDADAGRAPSGAEATLGGLYGEGDAGAVRLRLLWIGSRKPLAGQAVRLTSRRGTEVLEAPSDAEGRVVFPQVRPAKGYVVSIEGEGFSPVVIRGVSVHVQATTDLGDYMLGRDVVLRGRVVDAAGRPLPGAAVSVHTIERGLMTRGMLFYMAEQATSVPSALETVASDEEGYFAFSALDDGTYSLVARHDGHASEHRADVVVARERGAGVLTIRLSDAGRAIGRVTDQDGKGIPGAQVIGMRDVRRMSTNMLQREVAVTEADGSYVLDTLTAGHRYRFGVLAGGHAPMWQVASIEIGEVDVVQDFTLVRGGHLEGVVVDEATGKPIEGARVAIYVGSFNFGRGRARPDEKAATDTRLTDAQGRFRFEALTPGPAAAGVVKAPGYVSRTYSQWIPPAVTWPAIVADETQTVEVRLRRGGTVRGRVTSVEGGEPIQGAEVSVMQTDFMAAMGSFVAGLPTSVSAADGGFEIPGVPPGKYRLLAVADGFTPSTAGEGVEFEMPEGGGVVERDAALRSAGTVEGVVRAPDGTPLAGVSVRLRPGPTQDRRARMDMTRRFLAAVHSPADLTDEGGRFRMDGVSTGDKWVAHAESEEYVGGESKPFELEPGEVEAVEITMQAGGALRGRVVDESGRWLQGVRIQVGALSDDLAGRRDLNAWRVDRALDPHVYTTDEQGRFFAPNLQPGRVVVKASKDDYITVYKRNAVIRSGETFENYTVGLSPGETVEGTVSGADSRPLEGAMVFVTARSDEGSDDAAPADESADVEPAMFDRTDAQGRYRIEHVAPGTYNVLIWFAPGHKAWRRDNDAAAIRRDVTVPRRDVDFRLNAAEPGGGDIGGGQRGGGR
jgi:protocatechuate 3,4-dioxygenase beta subunit